MGGAGAYVRALSICANVVVEDKRYDRVLEGWAGSGRAGWDMRAYEQRKGDGG